MHAAAEPSTRVSWWSGPGRYLLLCGPLFALFVHHAWSDAWLGDFWVHLAAVQELSARPLAPRNPIFGNDYPYAFLSPYALALGLAARLGPVTPLEVLILQGLVNLALLLGALYAFVATWLGRRSAAFFALLFLLFLWGRDPWVFSGFFHLRSLAFVVPYPSTFAAALALATLAAWRRSAGTGAGRWAAAMLALATLWIVHPVNGLFLLAGLLVSSLSPPLTPRKWLALAAVAAASLALALAWPLYPVGPLWFGQIAAVHEGNVGMYDDVLRRVAPALLGAPWLFVRLRRNRRDPLSLFALVLAALVAYGAVSGAWSYGRLIAHAVLLLQIALADAAAALEGRLGRLRRGSSWRHVPAPLMAALLLAGSWSTAVRPMLEEGGRGDPAWLRFLESHVGRDDVVLTDLETCWYVPCFRGKVVAYPMRIPFVPDDDERLEAVARFFDRATPLQDRIAIIQRYRVAYVLLPKGHFPDWRERLAELRPLGRVVYSSPEHELLGIPGAPRAPR